MMDGLPDETRLRVEVTKGEVYINMLKEGRISDDVLEQHENNLNVLRRDYPNKQELISTCEERLGNVRNLKNSILGSIDKLKNDLNNLERLSGEQRNKSLKEIFNFYNIVHGRVSNLEVAMRETQNLD